MCNPVQSRTHRVCKGGRAGPFPQALNTAISTSRARHSKSVCDRSFEAVWRHQRSQDSMKGQSLSVSTVVRLPGYAGRTSCGPVGSAALWHGAHAVAHFATRVSTMGNLSGAMKAGNVAAIAMERASSLNRARAIAFSRSVDGSRTYSQQRHHGSAADRPEAVMRLMTARVCLSLRPAWLNIFQKTTSYHTSRWRGARSRKESSKSLVVSRFPGICSAKCPGNCSRSSKRVKSTW
jgi:hypothetical protein